MSTHTERPAGATPDDVGPSDLELRGTPAGLAPPAELEELYPDGTLVVAYSRISDDWRKNSRKKAASSSWKAGKGGANQHRRNDMNARRHGLTIVHRFTDNDLTASNRDVLRPDFQAMLNVLRRELPSAVLGRCWCVRWASRGCGRWPWTARPCAAAASPAARCTCSR